MSLLCVLSAAPRTPAQVRPLARRLLSMRPCADALLLLCDLPDAFPRSCRRTRRCCARCNPP